MIEISKREGFVPYHTHARILRFRHVLIKRTGNIDIGGQYKCRPRIELALVRVSIAGEKNCKAVQLHNFGIYHIIGLQVLGLVACKLICICQICSKERTIRVNDAYSSDDSCLTLKYTK